MADFIERFEPLARDYDVLLCDVWGVMHNGLAAFPAACEALMRFRAGGGTAILITNAPRSGEAVARILDRLKIPRGGMHAGDLQVAHHDLEALALRPDQHARRDVGGESSLGITWSEWSFSVHDDSHPHAGNRPRADASAGVR